MKKLLLIMLTISLLLAACGAGKTVSVQSTAPETTVLPTAAEPTAQTTAAAEATEPAALPTEQRVLPYTVKLTDPGLRIYQRPDFQANPGAMETIGQAGVYTIVEEATDDAGNRWGKLKSGAGWVCLSKAQGLPVSACLAEPDTVFQYHYDCQEKEYVTSIAMTANEDVYEFRFQKLAWNGDALEIQQELATAELFYKDCVFLGDVVFHGDMTTYGFSFFDQAGNTRYFALSLSGRDGSLECWEYTPQ